MRTFTKSVFLIGALAAVGITSIAAAQKLTAIPPKVTSVGGSHTCNGSNLQVSVGIGGGTVGTKGTVTVKRDSSTWTGTFDVPANSSKTVTVPTSWSNCHASGFFQVNVAGTNKLNAAKYIEPGSVTYKEASGPI